MHNPATEHCAQFFKKKSTIPADLLPKFCGFTHVSVKMYCRKTADPERRFKKSARPYEGTIFIHLSDSKGHMDQRPYCILSLPRCSRANLHATAKMILTYKETLRKLLHDKTLMMH